VASLETFLKADDLDALLMQREDLSLTPAESALVASVIHGWSDKQAVSNLLFHSDLIPATVRFEALDRALHSHDVPYFLLAATVGLQSIPLDDVPSDKRAAWIQVLLGLVRSKSQTLAGRASVTLFAWSQSVVPLDILPALVSLYPVPDEGACRNIIAAVLFRCGDLPADEFDRQLAAWSLSDSGMRALRSAHEEYKRRKAHDELRAMIMKSPSFAYIPNLSDNIVEYVGPDDPDADRRHASKPWWRFW
jgi:hypothetical protein